MCVSGTNRGFLQTDCQLTIWVYEPQLVPFHGIVYAQLAGDKFWVQLVHFVLLNTWKNSPGKYTLCYQITHVTFTHL